MTMETLSKVYDPHKVEKKWYSYWLAQGYFKARIDPNKEPFSVVIPPPNVTGSLHMGHALNNTLQDIVVRRKRMEGYVTLWLPGTDHAGIATQNVVEQGLAQEGLSREALGREKFLERVWSWKDKYGNLIIEQLKRLGCSCDWDRTRFTMDENYSRAVREVFVRLYQEGLIYKGNYLVNWCPRCQTALSDIEVEHHEINGHLWYIKYPFEDEEGYLTIATTRPETLLGDTAVAVHPKDKKYQKYIGKHLLLPVLKRRLPIIADSFVDPEFGTGAVKVTPAHDPNDFEIGKRHRLEEINIFTTDAKINENGGKYQGLDRFDCRKEIVKDLEELGLVERIEDYSTAIGHCYRCDTVVEPYLSEQWFVKMEPLAKPAIEAVKKGEVEFVPGRWKKIYFDWMENIKDWCISRQIWWGHRLPVYYCQQIKNEKCRMKNGIIVSVDEPQECPYCGSKRLEQEPDVLDTWFSSALWPFATLGWPEETEDFRYFYPTSLLSTSFDIIYFWVARMIMMGLHFPQKIPFSEVYIHALIRDVEGQKMSKSRGNVIDPLEVIEVYGTDALRFTLASLAVPGRDVYLSEERTQGYRNFMNKIWNASRFILMNLNKPSEELGARSEESEKSTTNYKLPTTDSLELADRWILSRYSRVIGEVSQEMESFAFNKSCKALYDFFWGDFCDWYIELAKPRLYSQQSTAKSHESKVESEGSKDTTDYRLLTTDSRGVAQSVLVNVLEGFLRLLHPFSPFITEEIWQQLQSRVQSPAHAQASAGKQQSKGTPNYRLPTPDSIMIAQWPKSDSSRLDDDAEKKMVIIQEITVAIRTLRSELTISPAEKVEVFLRVTDPDKLELLQGYSDYVTQLANLSNLSTGRADLERPKPSVVVATPGVEVYLSLGELDIEAEVKRFEKELEEIEESLAKVEKKLSTPQFMAKAPSEVIKKEKDKRDSLADKRKKLRFQLDQLRQDYNV